MARRFLPPASETAPPAPALDWLIACTALTLAPLTLWQPLWMPAAGLALLGWRALAARWHWRLPGRWLRLVLMVGLVAAVYRQYGTLFGRNPGVALLGLLAALKLFELERLRDYLLALFLLFLLVAGSFLYSQSLWLASYQLITVIAALATLARLTQPDLESPYAALRLTLGLLARAIPIILILYLLFPRIQGTLWGLPVDAYGGVTGVSDEMHPGSVNFLSQSEEVAFRASFANGASPPTQRLYWRVLVLWDTDGRSWLRGPTPSWPAAALAPSGPALDYTVTLEPTQANWLPALDWPVAAGGAGRFTPALTVEGPVVRDRRQYTLRAWPEPGVATLDPRERERALRLGGGASARVRALAAGWQQAGGGEAGVVEGALAHFRKEEFIYTLQPPELGDDAVDEFLFETRRGFCEHYTAAFVTLMRAAGIPSRVVLGYQGGEMNPAGDYLIVRQSDAHAWAEVWLEGRGWIRVDPTAAIAPERIEFGASALRRLYGQGLALGRLPPETLRSALRLAWLERWRERGRLGWDALNNAWNRWVLGYDQRRQRDLLRDFGLEAPSWSVLAGWLALASVALLALLALPWVRARGGDRVQDTYLRYCRKLARIGLARAPHEGPLDYARRCVRRRPDLQAAVEGITGRYVSLRYGERGGRRARRELRGLVRRFRPGRLAR